LGVVFLSDSAVPIDACVSVTCEVEFLYEPDVSYDALRPGMDFRIMEGGICVGTGRVLACDLN